ncbi:MAG: ABC transporter permease subunit [Christensenellaceae bacterium]|jgi:ABC-type transport system involved in multi-copper enzyme maturation permease subunit|nr:ABC transporter permease subunit [Christensenellaceae bacterium]
MLKEFKRIMISPGTLSVLILMIVVIFTIAVVLNFNIHPKTGLDCAKYTSSDELLERITSFQDQIKQYENEDFVPTQTIKDLKVQIRIMEFLIANEISYDYLKNNIAEIEIDFYSADIVDHIFTYGLIMFFCLVVCMLLVSIMTLNLDFTSGTARLLYALKRKRKKVLAEKYFGYITSIGLFTLIFSVIITIIGIQYKSNFSQILIVESQRIYLINSATYVSVFIVSLFLMIMFFSTVVFSISMLIRGVFASAFVNILFLSVYLILTTYSNGWITPFFSEIVSYYHMSINIGLFITLYLAKLILGVLLFIFARKRFLKREIY